VATIAKKSGLNRFRCHDLAHAPRKIKGLRNGRENRTQVPAANFNRFHGIRVRNVCSRLRADTLAPDQCAQAGAQKDHAPKSSGFFPGKAFLIQLPHGIRKADKNNCGRRYILALKSTDLGHGYGAGFRSRETVGSATDGRKSHAVKVAFTSQTQTGRVTGRQQFPLALSATFPDRPDGMNHVPRRQHVAASYPRLPHGAPPKGTALGQKPGTGRTVDGSIHSASAQKRRIGRVDNGVHLQSRYVGDNNGNHDLPPACGDE
jgi:hypothetical protein